VPHPRAAASPRETVAGSDGATGLRCGANCVPRRCPPPAAALRERAPLVAAGVAAPPPGAACSHSFTRRSSLPASLAARRAKVADAASAAVKNLEASGLRQSRRSKPAKRRRRRPWRCWRRRAGCCRRLGSQGALPATAIAARCTRKRSPCSGMHLHFRSFLLSRHLSASCFFSDPTSVGSSGGASQARARQWRRRRTGPSA